MFSNLLLLKEQKMSSLKDKCPDFSIEDVIKFVNNYYNIDSTVQRLVSYDDQNFLVMDKKNMIGGLNEYDITNIIVEMLNKELPSLKLQ